MNSRADSDKHSSISRHRASQRTISASVADLEGAGEEQLLHLTRSGTNWERGAAVTVLYERHCDKVSEMIDKRGIPLADAEDIFAEVWRIALEKLPYFEYTGTPLWHWLSRITKIQIDAYFRRRKVQNGRFINAQDEWLETLLSSEDGVGEENPPRSPQIQKMLDHDLPQLLAMLSEKERQILYCTFYEELDSTQIAKKFQAKPGTVRQQKRRALEKLRKLRKGLTDDDISEH